MKYQNEYYLLQDKYTGKFELANCHPLLNVELTGKDGWEVASGPYGSIDKAGKALCLAVESYDFGAYETWNEARGDLSEVITDCIDNDGNLDAIKMLTEIGQLLIDWDTDQYGSIISILLDSNVILKLRPKYEVM